MKRLLLAGIACVALAASPALAADMPPSRAPAYRPALVPYFNWTGVYVGLNAGGGWGGSSWESAAAFSTGRFNVPGGMIGGTAGANVQSGGVVFGLEGDIAWAAFRGTTTTGCAAGCQTAVDWFGTARARLGLAFDAFLPYVTGGAGFGNIRASTPGFTGANQTKVGWTAGGGLEYAWTGNWSAKLEYLYVDLGQFDCGFSCGAVSPNIVRFNAHLLRAGVNYKF